MDEPDKTSKPPAASHNRSIWAIVSLLILGAVDLMYLTGNASPTLNIINGIFIAIMGIAVLVMAFTFFRDVFRGK